MLCVSAYIDFFASLIQQVSLGDERRVRACDPRRTRAIQVTTSCVPSAVPAAEFRFGGVVRGPILVSPSCRRLPTRRQRTPRG
jgi:hypothetical protein